MCVKEYGIGLGAVFSPAGGGPPATLLAVTKIKADGGLASGALELPSAGTLRVTFDNTYRCRPAGPAPWAVE